MRHDARNFFDCGPAAFEHHQLVFAVLQYAMGGCEHQIGRNRNAGAQAVRAEDQDDVPGNRLLGHLRTANHCAGRQRQSNPGYNCAESAQHHSRCSLP